MGLKSELHIDRGPRHKCLGYLKEISQHLPISNGSRFFGVLEGLPGHGLPNAGPPPPPPLPSTFSPPTPPVVCLNSIKMRSPGRI
jgi:hypothetical protein